ncbi:MAG: Asp-tRNA(Asn)/Glu-tRNA(Gln) amidotransferase subunit GatC [Syntrophales bacterium]|nr:Asp-tRNA(Asn)/Glu-tRNA(Gln) amidotransferase subunit GatC [Syntrophales bacterium]MCK9527085.1 Asp-tRNA(Asn)/Glu-tRNA(Gln) amidotransferase subunit GatC [Syntrophales bacterium]MDX9921790.1 Asp-tRNA(Asn)/Glu-tRNA(Gln) amidotransferase subunit GatC [Syntrophales bacterium]
MKITQEQVVHVAHLARLNIRDDEIEMFTSQLNDILVYMDILDGADTTGVGPMSSVAGGTEPYREDAVLPSLGVEDALANAPDVTGGSFKVPKVID